MERFEDSEHVHIAVVEVHLFVAPGCGKAASHVPEVDHKNASLPSVVVDLLQDEWLAAGFGARSDAIEEADVGAWEGVDDAMVTEPAKWGVRQLSLIHI